MCNVNKEYLYILGLIFLYQGDNLAYDIPPQHPKI